MFEVNYGLLSLLFPSFRFLFLSFSSLYFWFSFLKLYGLDRSGMGKKCLLFFFIFFVCVVFVGGWGAYLFFQNFMFFQFFLDRYFLSMYKVPARSAPLDLF